MLPERDHSISTRAMNTLIQTYKENNKATVQNPILHKFHNNQVKEIVNNPEAAQFVVANGLTKTGEKVVILQTLDEKNNLLAALELSFPCPPDCY